MTQTVEDVLSKGQKLDKNFHVGLLEQLCQFYTMNKHLELVNGSIIKPTDTEI